MHVLLSSPCQKLNLKRMEKWMEQEGEEKAAQWLELGELGMLQTFRQFGASEEQIEKLVSLLESDSTSLEPVPVRPLLEDREDWMCVLLAILGRGAHPIQKLSLVLSDMEDVREICQFSKSSLGNEVTIQIHCTHNFQDELFAFCVNLASNPHLLELTIQDRLLVKAIASPRVCALIGYALSTNNVLKTLNMLKVQLAAKAVRSLMGGFSGNKTLRVLSLQVIGPLDGSLVFVAKMLHNNDTLRDLTIKLIGSMHSRDIEGVKFLSKALPENKTLEKLHLIVVQRLLMDQHTRPEEWEEYRICQLNANLCIQPEIHTSATDETVNNLECLLLPFNHAADSNCKRNFTVSDLSFDFSKVCKYESPVNAICSIIRTNRTLTKFGLPGIDLTTRQWVEDIIPALGENETLKVLDLTEARGLQADSTEGAWRREGGVYGPLLNLVHSSKSGLEEIELTGTKMSTFAGRISEELRMNKLYRRRFRDQQTVRPTHGRLVMCGFEFSGKTTICQTIRSGNSCWHLFQSTRKKKLQKHPRLRQLISKSRGEVHKELRERTRGFDILILGEEPETTAIWDFAGQTEYYVLHDYLFPNGGNTCFLYVCSAKLPPDEMGHREVRTRERMEQDFVFWMRFIASNSKTIQVEDSSGQSTSQRPDVTFILTNKDTLRDEREREQCMSDAEDIVAYLRLKFREVIDLSERVEFIDALCPKDVEGVVERVSKRLDRILHQSKEYEVCRKVCHALERWAANNRLSPLLSLIDFERICETEVQHDISADSYRSAQLDSSVGRETVLHYLNDVGQIIFIQGLDFIVVNPRWFGVGLLGSLINPFQDSETGPIDLETRANAPEHRQRKRDAAAVLCGCTTTSADVQSWTPNHDHGFVGRNRIDKLLQKSLSTMGLNPNVTSDKLISLMIQLEMCFEEHPGDAESRLFVPALFDGVNDEESAGRRKWQLRRPSEEERVCHFMGHRLKCENEFLTFLTPGFFPRLQVVLRNYLHEQKWTDSPHFKVSKNLIRFACDGMEIIIEYSGDNGYFVDILVWSSKTCEDTLRFVENEVEKKIFEFCASPQGCQGVQLVVAVIRPICVHNLTPCAKRKDQEVLVSDLERQMKHRGKDYKHTWRQELGTTDCEPDISHHDYALDLLEGEGSHRRCTSTPNVDDQAGTSHPLSSHQPISYPKRFYPTIEDVGCITRLEAMMNSAREIPINLHLMCDGMKGMCSSHEVPNQRGRPLRLMENLGARSWPFLKYAIRLFWIAMKIGVSTFAVAPEIREIDDWVRSLFANKKIPIDVDMLERMMNHYRPPGHPLSKETILNLLGEYLKMDPSTQWLIAFLDVQDSDRFHHDFLLYKVSNTHTSEIGWLCREHFEDGMSRGIVRSAPH